MFSPSNELFVYVSSDFSLFKTTSSCLNPNLALSLSSAVVLQFMITLIANSLSIKIMLVFLVHLVYIYIFYDLKVIFLKVNLQIFMI